MTGAGWRPSSGRWTGSSLTDWSRYSTLLFIEIWDPIYLFKGLSHEIDLKNFDKFTERSLIKERGWFLNTFRGSDDFIMQKVKVYLLLLMPVYVMLAV